MEGLIMTLLCTVGTAAAVFIGFRVGYDRGIGRGIEEATEALQEIQKQGEEDIRRIEKAIDVDCPWK